MGYHLYRSDMETYAATDRGDLERILVDLCGETEGREQLRMLGFNV